MILNEDYHIGTFINNENVTVNYNQWQNGNINKLFILGLMGASKSTTCKRLAKKYNCKFIEFDIFKGNIWYTDEELLKQHPLIYEYFKTIYEPKYGSRMDMKDIKHGPTDILTSRQKEFLYWALEKPERIIIEGLISQFIEDDEQLMQYPMILIGTSKLTSASRMMKRQISYQVHNWKNGYYDMDEIKNMIKMLSRYEQEQENQNRVRDKIISHNNGNYGLLNEDYDQRKNNTDLPLIMEAMRYKPHTTIFSDDARQAVMDQEYDEIHETASIRRTFTHKELCDVYEKKSLNESYSPKIPHVSGNITQYVPGAYFNEEVGVWMRKPNQEEVAKVYTLYEDFKINMEFLNNEYV